MIRLQKILHKIKKAIFILIIFLQVSFNLVFIIKNKGKSNNYGEYNKKFLFYFKYLTKLFLEIQIIF